MTHMKKEGTKTLNQDNMKTQCLDGALSCLTVLYADERICMLFRPNNYCSRINIWNHVKIQNLKLILK